MRLRCYGVAAAGAAAGVCRRRASRCRRRGLDRRRAGRARLPAVRGTVSQPGAAATAIDEDLAGRRRGARRAARPAGERPRLGGRGRHPAADARRRLSAGRQGLPGLPASGDARGGGARPHRAQDRTRLSRLRLPRRTRRDARARPAAPRPDDQCDGAAARRHDRRSRSAASATCSDRVLRHVSPAFAEDPVRILRRGALRRPLCRLPRRAGNGDADARRWSTRAKSMRWWPSACGRSCRAA